MLIASMGEMGLSHDNILEGDECLRQYWFEVEFLDFVSHLLYLLYEILLQTSKMSDLFTHQKRILPKMRAR